MCVGRFCFLSSPTYGKCIHAIELTGKCIHSMWMVRSHAGTCKNSTWRQRAEGTSQTCTVPSREADSSQRASWAMARSVMRSLWPLNRRTLLTASMSYLRSIVATCPSLPLLFYPSNMKVTGKLCARQNTLHPVRPLMGPYNKNLVMILSFHAS